MATVPILVPPGAVEQWQPSVLDNTHIIFFADHGDIHGSHGQFMKTAPWEESIRIPCVIGGGDATSIKQARRTL